MKPLILIDRHEGVHEVLQLDESVTASNAAHLVILLHGIWLDARVVDEEWHWLLYVGANLHWGRMVGQYGDAYRLVPGAHLVEDRLDEALVQVLDGLELSSRSPS